MTDEKKDSLGEEKNLCLGKLRAYSSILADLQRQREVVWPEYCKWKERYEKADLQLALESKLTIVKRGRKSETADSLEAVLKDKEKVKKLIMLLREEVKPCIEEKRHGELMQGT